MLSRRRFLAVAGGAAAGGAVAARLAWGSLVSDNVPGAPGTAGPSTFPPGTLLGPDGAPTGPIPGRVLVVIQLSGGNDGLNTLVPAGDGRYFDARPTLRIDESAVVALSGSDHFGIAPQLAPLVPLWDSGHLAAIESIGFPDQTRSHFAAMDTWWSAVPKQPIRTGWLGRWLDVTGDVTNPLRGLALGGGSPALVGEKAVATVVLDPASFTLATPKGSDRKTIIDAFLATAAPLAAQPELAAAQRAVPASVQAVDLLARAAQATDPADPPDDGDGYVGLPKRTGERSAIADLLQTAAGIIELDLGTQIILVAGNGFDTHTDQAARHTALLTDLAEGITSFLVAIEASGHADDVLVVTTSEFGRRVEENGSGTDHGNGGVQFVIGNGVQGARIVGDADLATLDLGDLVSAIDTRSLYAIALDWLSGATGPTDAVLGGTYDRYGLVRA